LKEVVAEIEAAGGSALAIQVDVSDADQVEAMVAATVSRFGGLDIMFNNAARTSPEHNAGDLNVVTLDLDVWERTMAVNLRGPMLGCRFAIPEMQRRGGGSIINTASIKADLADNVRCAYGVSKAGLVMLTKNVAAQFGKDRIRCNVIKSGFVLTPALDAMYDEAAREELLTHHMAAELAVPQDIAALAVFLASDASCHLTAQAIAVDGGFTGRMPNIGGNLRGGQYTRRTI
jgi:NAD(P)-dependent dehydrogenase (short-subunit alcohol dehydrogenase family)